MLDRRNKLNSVRPGLPSLKAVLVLLLLYFVAQPLVAQQNTREIDYSQLVSFDTEQAVLLDTASANKQNLSVELKSIARIKFPASVQPAEQSYLIRLVDSSMLRAKDFTISGDEIIFQEASEASKEATTHQLPLRNVQSVQLSPLTNELEKQWAQFNERQGQAGDRLVFQRDSALDFLEGSVQKVDQSVVGFRMSDRVADAPRERVVGLVFYHAESRTFPTPTAILTTAKGSSIQIESCKVDDERVTVKTLAGSELTWAFPEVFEISFQSTRAVWLSDMTPSTVDWQPLIASPAVVEELRELNRPRFNESFARQPLQLRVADAEKENSTTLQTFSRGIAIKGGTRLVFAMQQPFSTLSGTVGFAPTSSAQGNVELVISGDGQALYRETLKAKSESTIALNLDVTSIKRLTFQVNYNDGSSAGDLLHLCDLKVTR